MVSFISLTREKLLWDIGTLCEKCIALIGEIKVKWSIARKRLSGTSKTECLGKKKNQEMPGDMKDAGWVIQDSIYISRNGLI